MGAWTDSRVDVWAMSNNLPSNLNNKWMTTVIGQSCQKERLSQFSIGRVRILD